MPTATTPPSAALALVLTLAACGAPAPPAAPRPPESTTATAAESPPPATTTTPLATPTPPVEAPAKAAPAKDPLEVTVTVSDALRAVVAAKDRSDADKKLDAGRHPAELLAFVGAAPGKRIAEIGSYQGYMAELLARAVAPGGKVYAQDPQGLNKLTRENWAARKASPAMKTIVRVERPFDDPIPADVKDLDAVVCGLFYHDMVWLKVDRAKMNASIFRALKPGGVYFVYDHSGREGTGVSEAKTIHRIEEKVARAEIEAAGFKLAATAAFLRNPDDKMDWDASDDGPKDRRGTSDRFALKFVKP